MIRSKGHLSIFVELSQSLLLNDPWDITTTICEFYVNLNIWPQFTVKLLNFLYYNDLFWSIMHIRLLSRPCYNESINLHYSNCQPVNIVNRAIISTTIFILYRVSGWSFGNKFSWTQRERGSTFITVGMSIFAFDLLFVHIDHCWIWIDLTGTWKSDP